MIRSIFQTRFADIGGNRNMASGAGGGGQSLPPGFPKERTITGYPKWPPGTKLGKMVMGEYGPYCPKRRYWQEYMAKNPDIPIYFMRGTSDKVIVGLSVLLVGVVVVGLGLSCNCILGHKTACKIMGVD